jgi:hypothetical protein
MDKLNLLLSSDTISIDEFSAILAKESGKLDRLAQFRDLILRGVKACTLIPIHCSNNDVTVPLEHRAYEFATKDAITWTTEKELLPPISLNQSLEHDQTLNHSTPLMDIQKEAIKKFWLNYTDDSPPKSEIIIEWLTVEKKLSMREASAIDNIIRPSKYKRGGNKRTKK